MDGGVDGIVNTEMNDATVRAGQQVKLVKGMGGRIEW